MMFNEKYVEDIPLILNRNFTTLQLMALGSQKIVGWSHAATKTRKVANRFSPRVSTSAAPGSNRRHRQPGPNPRDYVVNPNLDAVTEASRSSELRCGIARPWPALRPRKTKSGSNEFHGSGFYFRRSDAQLARDPFTQSPNQATRGPAIALATIRFYLGGPVIKDKLFFFGDYQRENV